MSDLPSTRHKYSVPLATTIGPMTRTVSTGLSNYTPEQDTSAAPLKTLRMSYFVTETER